MTQDKEEKKKLPSNRFSLDKQVEILKIIAIIQQTKGVGSNYKDLAKHTNANPTIVSETLQFWKQVGILENSGRDYVPSLPLVEFNKQMQWGNEDSAWAIFGTALQDSWFMDALKIKFQIKNALSLEELSQMLGSESGIPKRTSKTDTSIGILIHILENAGLIIKDQSENYVIGQLDSDVKKEIKLEDEKDMVQISVGDELYAVAVDEIKEFVISKGKKLSKTIQKVD